MATQHPITERDLKDAYKRSGLWRIGMSYERAIAVPPIRTSLTCSVRAQRHRAEQSGQQLPAQLGLI